MQARELESQMAAAAPAQEGSADPFAAQALDHVERQLTLTRQRRQGLDSIEAKLWTRGNALERFLIHTRGRAWWRARRNRAQAETLASERM
jgi:hypothetical protein